MQRWRRFRRRRRWIRQPSILMSIDVHRLTNIDISRQRALTADFPARSCRVPRQPDGDAGCIGPFDFAQGRLFGAKERRLRMTSLSAGVVRHEGSALGWRGRAGKEKR
jgi:hypothetical protein